MLNLAKPILVAFLLLILSGTDVYCQYYTLGNDPGRARWRTITSEHYKIIYPEETDSIARIYLYTLEQVRPRVMAELNIDPKPIPVILHPYTTQSNGVVTWAPKRMDLFSSPDPYGSNPDPWIRHLSIHESRHVGQVEHFTKGIYNVFYYLLGEQVTGLGLGLFADRYTMEGDAVIAETELTNGGRGRNADFISTGTSATGTVSSSVPSATTLPTHTSSDFCSGAMPDIIAEPPTTAGIISGPRSGTGTAFHCSSIRERISSANPRSGHSSALRDS